MDNCECVFYLDHILRFSMRRIKTLHSPFGKIKNPTWSSISGHLLPCASYHNAQITDRGDFRYETIYKSKKEGSKARVGRIITPHGTIDTPGFVGVGTNGAMKGLTMEMVKDCDLQLMFNNTFHLLVHPGPEIVAKMGGLHKYTGWDRPLITDSGGFQVFSLLYTDSQNELKGKKNKKTSPSVMRINEEGVLFRSYRDGGMIMLTPESSVKAQKMLGADIIIPFDELPPNSFSPEQLEMSMERTHRWELRSLEEHLRNPREQAMYAVIHGGTDLSLRKKSVEFLSKHPFDGYAIGGSLGKDKTEMRDMLEGLSQFLPRDKPIHLLGIGDIEGIELCLPFGFETFDSSYPTRLGRHGTYLTR